MSGARQQRQPAGAISTILAGVRRAERQIRRGSRDVVESAVSQLFDATVQPHGVQASGDGSQWETVTEVLGTGGVVSVEVLNPAPALTYRLVTERGNGTPSPGLRLPVVHLLPVQDGAVRVVWQTNHWENYALNEIGFDGSKTLLHFVQGDGGASVFELPIEAPVRLVQVEAALK